MIDDAEILADDERLAVSVWRNKDIVFLMVRGTVIPFTVNDFVEFVEVLMSVYGSNVLKNFKGKEV